MAAVLLLLIGALPAWGEQMLREVVQTGVSDEAVAITIVFQQPVEVTGQFQSADGKTWTMPARLVGGAAPKYEEVVYDELDNAIRRVAVQTGSADAEIDVIVELRHSSHLVTQVQLDRERITAVHLTDAHYKSLVRGLDNPSGHTLYTLDLGNVPAVLSANIVARSFVERYVVYVTPDGRLGLGLFDTLARAFSTLRQIKDAYPSATVQTTHDGARGYASAAAIYPPLEPTRELSSDQDRLAPQIGLAAVTLNEIDGLTVERQRAHKVAWAEEPESGLMQEGEAAFTAGEYDRAVAIYTKASLDPRLRADALELLGVTREIKGQQAHAKAVYERYLAEYPEHANAVRVQMRLDSILAPRVDMVVRTAAPEKRHGTAWRVFGNASQFYQTHYVTIDDEISTVAVNALYTDANVIARRRSERSEHQARISLGHIQDFGDDPDDRTFRIHQAYWESDWGARNVSFAAGRQSLRHAGILGRVDGVRVGYQPTTEIGLNLVGGYGVDSTFEGPDTSRPVFGLYSEMNVLDGRVAVTPYLVGQNVDGITDRQAVGFQSTWFGERSATIASIDYDVHHGALNNLFLSSQIPVGDRSRVSASYQFRRSPYLTTRNALIGQPFEDLTALKEAHVDLELEELAADRTAESTMVRVGANGYLSRRLSFSTDVSYSEFSRTEASFNVAQLPAREDLYVSAQLRANDVFGDNTYADIQVRYAKSSDSTTQGLMFNNRFTVGERLQLQTRLRVENRSSDSGSDQVRIAPSLRFDYRFFDRAFVELETGYEWTERSSARRDLSIERLYLRLGFRATFH